MHHTRAVLQEFMHHNYVCCEYGYGLSRELEILWAERSSAPTDLHRKFEQHTDCVSQEFIQDTLCCVILFK